ncbi:bifunctional UDP-N-acetylglucosamine diphosphorylase/glucosamine-1-phosphate N-acetyltransferase GlmU [Thiolapillus sp.]|uniref:bifunctional UDP-N-acetylglucosamine diphosphorylase/glucosamine-1-phosphate N-acetyltransferase GlmU n=1 Tax=Thiolapillus sp. TaxID=2017437 RepID=UPI003AF43465
MKLGIVILAAGQGTRMKSSLPKVLHPLAGRPLLAHVLETARSLQPAKTVVVYGHGGERVRDTIDNPDILWVEQAEQLGTGHAVQQAMPLLQDMDKVLVRYGDVPLIRAESLQALVHEAVSGLGLMTVTLDDPIGYGRIERDADGRVLRIVEQKDASEEQLAIPEINTGIMLIDTARLRGWLQELSPQNAQGEYYLTDIIAMAVRDGVDIHVTQPADTVEAEGINDCLQLASLERVLQRWQAEALMRDGVTLKDPARFDLRGSLTAGTDVILDVNVIIEGQVVLGNNVTIGANTVLRNVQVADNVCIRENCVIEDAVIGPDSAIGPFSRIRPGTELVGGAHVGNFVEIKNSTIGLGSKVNHLSYIGDTQMGSGVNIGAGTITCNYDGAYKHQTVIEDKSFIGSNAALVAPVRIGQNATIGAGSVIAKDAEAGELTLARGKQVTIRGWKRPSKEK